jgi:hypothetical protein
MPQLSQYCDGRLKTCLEMATYVPDIPRQSEVISTIPAVIALTVVIGGDFP